MFSGDGIIVYDCFIVYRQDCLIIVNGTLTALKNQKMLKQIDCKATNIE